MQACRFCLELDAKVTQAWYFKLKQTNFENYIYVRIVNLWQLCFHVLIYN